MWRFLVRVMLLPGLWAAGRDIVVVDTDSGLFGDDGAAAVMLLRSPSQVTVGGITLVPGNVWPAQGAEYMLHILDLLQRTQPALYGGAEPPWLGKPNAGGALALGRARAALATNFNPFRDPSNMTPWSGISNRVCGIGEN